MGHKADLRDSVASRMLDCPRRRSVRSLNALADDFDPCSSSSPPRHDKQQSSSPFSSDRDSGLKKRKSRTRFANDTLTPQASLQANGNGGLASAGAFDPFVAVSAPLSAAAAVGPVPANPYSHDTAALNGAAFFASQSGFQQPVRGPLLCFLAVQF